MTSARSHCPPNTWPSRPDSPCRNGRSSSATPRSATKSSRTSLFPGRWPTSSISTTSTWTVQAIPRGLTDKDILLEAKILTVADVVEAMSSHRPYRPSLGLETALDEIHGGTGHLLPRRERRCLPAADRRKTSTSPQPSGACSSSNRWGSFHLERPALHLG